ncbi:MAG TPA: DUF3397 domain-containing protein [Chondromyces sp.]|nr:DUF3397 domain-containing protein [Chondromyces sp.]
MENIITLLISIIVFVPLLGYIAVFMIAKKMFKHHRKAVGAAIDISTIFFLCSVHYLIRAIWDVSLFWLLIAAILIIVAVFTVMHWKVKKEILFMKVFRGSWRVSFLLFFSLYIILFLYGIISRVIHLNFIV